MASQDLGSGEVLKVFVISDNVNWSTGAFKVVSPDTEGFKDSLEFFVVGVIVEFQSTEGAGMEKPQGGFRQNRFA